MQPKHQIDIRAVIDDLDELQEILKKVEGSRIEGKGDQLRLRTINEYIGEALLYARNISLPSPRCRR